LESKEISRLQFIRVAKQHGFTLNLIRQITQHAEAGDSRCGDVRRIIPNGICENRAKIEQMEHLQSRMEEALAKWEGIPDDVPSVCHLIESVAD